MSNFFIKYFPTFGQNEHGFGVIPDPPEMPDCKERFIEEFCEYCSNYKECKAEYEKLLEEEGDE